jgi:hypothetical protein
MMETVNLSSCTLAYSEKPIDSESLNRSDQ